MSKQPTVLLGVTGSIAAYKSADIASALVKKGCDVHVLMSAGGERFLSPITLQTLTKNRVHTDVFQEDDPGVVKHIALAEAADLVLVAPASANAIAKLAHGMADDMFSATLLAAWEAPLLIAPAMNTHMFENPATQYNLGLLISRGWEVVEPKESRLACGTVGKGALADVGVIVERALARLG